MKPLFYHKVAGIGQDGLMQARDVTNEIVKAVAGDAARSVQVYAPPKLSMISV